MTLVIEWLKLFLVWVIHAFDQLKVFMSFKGVSARCEIVDFSHSSISRAFELHSALAD